MKIKSSFYNNFCPFLVIFVLATPAFAFSQQCIDSFRNPIKLESILTLEDINQIQDLSIKHITYLADKIYATQEPSEKQVYTDKLSYSWNIIRSWDRIRNFDQVLTELIVEHFERRLKASVVKHPELIQRLYNNDLKSSSLSILNFHYQLPYILNSLKMENVALKEIPNEEQIIFFKSFSNH